MLVGSNLTFLTPELLGSALEVISQLARHLLEEANYPDNIEFLGNPEFSKNTLNTLKFIKGSLVYDKD